MKTKLLLSLAITILQILPVYTQNIKIDSLWQVGKDVSVPKFERIAALADIVLGYNSAQIGEVLKNIKAQAKDSDNLSKVYAYKVIGDILSSQSKNKESLKILLEAEKLMNKKFGDTEKHLLIKGGLLIATAQAYAMIGNEEEGIKYLLRGIEVQKQNKHTAGIAVAYMNLGIMHSSKNDHEEGIKYIKKALPYADSLSNKFYKAFILNNLAGVYQNNKQFNSADSILNKVEKFDKEFNNSMLKYDILQNKANVQKDLGNYKEALKLYKKLEKH